MGLWDSLNTACLTAFGETVTFRDPLGALSDAALTGIFSERDMPEPDGRGHYTTLFLQSSQLPVTNPLRRQNPYQIVVGAITYNITGAVADEGGGHTLKLKKV